MRGTFFIPATLSLLTILCANGEPSLDFNRDIRPILSGKCFSCHGPDEEARKGKLRLDTAEDAKKALGPADESELVYRVETNDEDDMMPPGDSGHPLTAEQIATLRKWVEQGAPYATHWAFDSPVKEAVPEGVHAIDHFVNEGLKKNQLTLPEKADRYTLIRRLSLGLTGLPPTIEDADEFVKSGDIEAPVDRLLASESFGEHWARMWLDLARYADTKGYEKDRHRDMWRYRDWVIDALNRDMPFDQFTIEQLAGDLLPTPTSDQLLATAFHRNTMENDEGGTDNEEFRVAAVKDRVDTTVQVWMGLTMGCARCHTHKYDPITIEDYYGFYAIFNQTVDADNVQPVSPFPTAKQVAERVTLETKAAELTQLAKNRPGGFEPAFTEWKSKFEEAPLWRPLQLTEMKSKHGVTLSQKADGNLKVDAENAERDTWVLTLDIPEGIPITALRIDTVPKVAGGKWSNKNLVINELTAEWIAPGGKAEPVSFANPRADFSQKHWDVAKAIDGNAGSGWAFSPKVADAHAAVFDFAKSVAGGKLRLTIAQEYGQGLIFEEFRLSASQYPTNWLEASLEPEADLERVFAGYIFEATRDVTTQLVSAKRRIEVLDNDVPKIPIMRELASGEQRTTRVHNRGNFLDEGEEVAPSILSIFGQESKEVKANTTRLDVAQWLIQPDNPLTARVMVNRVWARLFGIGIVETEEDFGSQGMVPTHPELLDWLAVDYRENGWSLKALLKTIVLSQTYQQSSVVTSDSLNTDPRNQLLSRGPRFRLSAEMLRDQALASSGLLTEKLGGPSVMPPQPDGVWKGVYSGSSWENAVGPDRYRRGLYTYLKRTSPHPAMTTFDAGSGEVCQIRRVRTNTPLQALVTLNDPAFVEAAGALSQRMSDFDHGFRLVLIRPPSEMESKRLQKLYTTMQENFSRNPEEAKELLESAGLEEGDAAKVAVASVILNLDETLMKP